MADVFGAGGETLHVSIDETSLKIAKLRKNSGRTAVAGIYTKTIAGLATADVAHELLAGLEAVRTKVRKVSLVLPSRYVITKNIEVPSLDEEEIQSIVRLQAVRHTPYSKEEVTVGHLNLEVLMERYTKTLLVIGSNENIKKKTDIVAAAGCELESVHLCFEVLARAVEACKGAGAAEGPYGCIFLDAETTDFIAVKDSLPYFIRSIPVGARQLRSDVSGGIRKLMEEFRKTWDACQTECQGAAPGQFFVIGPATAEAKGICAAIGEELKIPASTILLEEHLNFLPEAKSQLEQSGPNLFSDVIFDGMTGDGVLGLDLLPDELRLKRSFRAKGREMFTMGVFMLAVFGLIVGTFLVQIYFRNNCLKEMKQNYEQRQQEADKLVAISDETKLINHFKKKRGTVLGAIDEFQKILPQEMYIGEITLNDEGRFSVKGTSDLMSLVFSFVTEMENDPMFGSVTSDYTKSRKEGDRDVSDFGISCTLEEGAARGR